MEFMKIDTGNIRKDMTQYTSLLKNQQLIRKDLELRRNELLQIYGGAQEDRIISRHADEEKRQEAFEKILLEEATLDRIWDAYRSTGPDNHILLYELYVQREKWDSLEIKYGSRASLSIRRQKAVSEALKLYNNEAMSNEELHRFANQHSSFSTLED